MPQGGHLLIETSNEVLDEPQSRLDPSIKPGEYVLVSVSDTGCGMDQETLTHVYEPFYSTKGKVSGTGLGLSTVYELLKRCDGYVAIESQPGHGTTVRLYIPSFKGKEVRMDCGKRPKEHLPAGVETVLVVDDENDIREAAKRRLEACGYEVLTAGDGHEALKVLKRRRGGVALLFSDVVMPKAMDGYTLAEEALDLDPELKVLLTSGVANYSEKTKELALPRFEFLSKPYTKSMLVNKVRNVLDNRI